MSWSSLWFRSSDLRRAVALGAVVVATGGLVLHRASPSSAYGSALQARANEARFVGPGAHGSVALSHGKVLANGTTRIFAEVRLRADEARLARERAPIALAIVLDTSGSMEGSKLEDAKRAVLALVSQMRDEDSIAFVTYDDRASLDVPLGPVGDVRQSIRTRIDGLQARGGTNIAAGLETGLAALARGGGSSGRKVRRVVLVSDGLDSGRSRAEHAAEGGAENGITISSLGVGLDFDESYLGALASRGHGNFGFVSEGASLETFLRREHAQAADTTVLDAHVSLDLPQGIRFVSAEGARATAGRGAVELDVGSLFAGDERRIVVELDVVGDALPRGPVELGASARWRHVNGERADVRAPFLALVPTTDSSAVAASRDGAVHASATSVLASRRQLAATAAYASGDVEGARRLTAENEAALADALVAAPGGAKNDLDAQLGAYRTMRKDFAQAPPSSPEGKAVAKAAAAKEQSNVARKAY